MPPKLFWRSLITSLAVTLALVFLQLAAFDQGDFLGQKTDTLAKGLLSFYPAAAYLAVARVGLVAWLLIFLFTYICFGTLLHYRGRPLWLRIGALGSLALAPAAWMLSSLITYPAMYSSYLSENLAARLFRASFWLSPSYLDIAGFGLVAIAAGPWLLRRAAMGFYMPKPLAASLVVMGGLAVAVSAYDSGPSQTEKPHVLLIGVDSLRADRLDKSDVMPAVQELLKSGEATLFKDHFVGVPRTFPSWVEILQGRYAAQTGIRHMFPGMDKRAEEFTGLGSVFRDAGYHTAVISDFAGDIFPRLSAGFEEVKAPNLSITTMIEMGSYQSFPLFFPATLASPFWSWFPNFKESATFSNPNHLVDGMQETLAEEGDKPVFMVSFFSTAHFPYAAPYPYYRQFADPKYQGPFKFQKNPSLQSDEALKAEDIRQIQALYDGALRSVDDALADMFQYLKDEGLWDQTLIVLTADHGEDLFDGGQLQGHGEHLRGEHVLKVPLVIKPPKAKKPVRQEALFTTRSIDIASTVAALAGVAEKIGDGEDLSPWMADADLQEPHLRAYSESGIWFSNKGEGFFQQKRLPYPGISGLLHFDLGGSNDIVLKDEYEDVLITSRHRSLVDGDYKIIYMPTEEGIEYEVYNRRLDPANLQDLSETETAKTDELAKKLMDTINRLERQYQIVDGYILSRY